MLVRMRILQALLNPERVAVVGASQAEGSAGWRIVHRLQESHFGEGLVPVNARHSNVLGVACAETVAQARPDLAILAVPAAEILDQSRAAADAGAKALLVVSAEVPGEALQGLVALCAEREIALVGPESFGLAVPGSRLDTTVRVGPLLRDGGLVVLTAGGQAAEPVAAQLAARAVGLRLYLDVGLGLGLSLAQLAMAMAQDEGTRAIAVHGWTPGPDEPSSWLGDVAAHKPLVVYAPELADATVEVAGERLSQAALLRAAGVHLAGSSRELVTLGAALAAEPRAHGRGVLVVTETPLVARAAARALAGRGFSMPELDAATREHILSEVRPSADATNPVLLTTQATGRHLDVVLDAGLAQDPIHAAVVLTRSSDAGFVHHRSRKPVLGVGAAPVEDFDDAALALVALSEGREAVPPSRPQDLAPDAFGRVQTLIAGAALTRRRSLTSSDALRALECYGVATAPSVTVGSPVSARRAAEETGYPVILKGSSAAGRRRFGPLGEGESVEAAVREAVDALGPSDPHLWLAVEPVGPGTPLYLMMVSSPWLGAVCALGSGEGVDAADLAPRSLPAARRLVDEALGEGVLVRDALAELIWRVGCLAADFPELSDLEVGPIYVDERGRAAAHDAVIGFEDLF